MSKKSRGRQLSEKVSILIADFDIAAQSYGWERDQGSEEASNAAQLKHQRAYEKLARYIKKLEAAVELHKKLAPYMASVEAGRDA